MTVIGVISDTHLNSPDSRFKECVERCFKKVDLIVHCGDVTSLSIIEYLKRFAPVHAVHGNMDPPDVAEELPEKMVVEVEEARIGIVHGWGAPLGIVGRVLKVFSGENVHAIFFGHSHVACKEVKDGVFMFNPGPFARGWFSKKTSIGIVKVEGRNFSGEHVEV